MGFKRYLSKHLILDGYNVLNAVPALKVKMSPTLEEGRNALNELLVEYAAITGEHVVVVYDAYKGRSKTAVIERTGHLEVVFTKENETADSYIESLAEALSTNKRNMVRVVTSDWAEQQIVLGTGASRVAPNEFYEDYLKIKGQLKKDFEHRPAFATLEGRISEQVLKELEKWRKG